MSAEFAPVQPASQEAGISYDEFIAQRDHLAGIRRIGERVAVGAAGATLAGLALAACGSSSNHHEAKAGTPSLAAACANIDFVHPTDTYGGNLPYGNNSFVARFKLDSANDVQPAVASWFSKGPLGDKVDPASLAILDAAIAMASHDGKAANPNYPLLANAEAKLLSYAGGNTAQAKADCELTDQTMTETGGFETLKAGTTVTAIQPVRTGSRITSYTFPSKPVLKDTSVIAFKASNTKDPKIDGFETVYVADDGEVWFLGSPLEVSQQETKNPTPRGNQPTTSNQPVGSEKTPQPQQKQNQQQQQGGGTGSNQGQNAGSQPGSKQGVAGPVGPTKGKQKSFGHKKGHGEAPTGTPSVPETGPGTGTTPGGETSPAPGTSGPGSTPPVETTPPVVHTTPPVETTPPVVHTTPPSTPPETTPPHTTPPASTPPVLKSSEPINPTYSTEPCDPGFCGPNSGSNAAYEMHAKAAPEKVTAQRDPNTGEIVIGGLAALIALGLAGVGGAAWRKFQSEASHK